MSHKGSAERNTLTGEFEMEYMGNKEYWDEKFAKREDNLLSPEMICQPFFGQFFSEQYI